MKRAAIAVAVVLVAALILWKRGSSHPTRIQGSAMGCGWTVEWRGDAPDPKVLKREISAELEEWEQVLSQWREGSDLSRHNRGEPAGAKLSRVLALAEKIHTDTGGAFDHRLLENVHAAGFGPPGKGIDLSSIGKGFAVDRVCERLHGLGISDFVFALAGEVRTSGSWQVDIEKPGLSGTTVARSITLENRAVATSGNYRQFRETPEGLATHIIDPKTGRPVIRPPSSVTVIAADCATASAWATALFVLGPESDLRPQDAEVIWQMPGR